MNTLLTFKTHGMKSAALSLIVAAFAATIPLRATASMMSWADHTAQSEKIKSEYKADKAACKPMTGNTKDICYQEAKSKSKIARAELDFSRSGTARDGNKVMVLKADGAFAIAKERCDDQMGTAKSICRAEAKTIHVKAIADAKLSKKEVSAKTSAMDQKQMADYGLAVEKCNGLTVALRFDCISAAKTRFNQM
jgi:uncharacterized membrane protein